MSDGLKRLQADLGVVADGVFGPASLRALTMAANAGRVTVKPAEIVVIKEPDQDADIPEVGRAKLVGVHDVLQLIVLQASVDCDVPFTVIEGRRTAARQAQLVAAGASKTQNSRHLTGHAVDLWPLDPVTGKALPSDVAFPAGSAAARDASARLWSDLRKIAAVMKRAGASRGVTIEWGGDWGWDAPHFQLSRREYPA